MNEKYEALYQYMATSNKPSYMHTFGKVMSEMMEWMISNKGDLANEWIEKLESIKWKNYLTQKEAIGIVSQMMPKAPWSREQWSEAMLQHGFEKEREPYYNPCALFVTMNMIYSDSSETLRKYVSDDKLFDVIYSLATDKLEDKDGKFSVRRYFL